MQLTVLNPDGIIDFKSVAYFPDYAKVLSEKCYKNKKDNAPGSSKLDKVKWSNIVQMKLIKGKTKAMFYKCEYESKYECCNFQTESALTQNKSKKQQSQKQQPTM